MKVKCANCNKMFKIVQPDAVGPEGATCGVYQDSKSSNCLYNPELHVIHPRCPWCDFVDTGREIKLVEQP